MNSNISFLLINKITESCCQGSASSYLIKGYVLIGVYYTKNHTVLAYFSRIRRSPVKQSSPANSHHWNRSIQSLRRDDFNSFFSRDCWI